MDSPEQNFKINLNQNLWGLVVGLVSLGIAEHFQLYVLFCFAAVLSVVMVLSVISTTIFYTINYCRNKMKKWKMDK
jgi:hypothetical protein